MTEALGVWEAKVWGRTRCTHAAHLYSRHELEVTAGTFCSFHWHEHRANLFRVYTGKVRVVYTHGWRVGHTDLEAGDMLRVPSLVAHQFQVIESGEMVEEYYPDRNGAVKLADIHRLSEGGVINALIQYPETDPFVLLPNGQFWQGKV